MPLPSSQSEGGLRSTLASGTSLSTLPSTRELRKANASRLGRNFTIGDKVGSFAQSTLESFPELFGIEPTEATQEFRALNPVSGFASQAVGAFVPYLGAMKAVRANKMLNTGITAFENLGKSAITRGARGAAAEAAVIEAGRLGISATPLPEQLYEATTGLEAESRPLGIMAGEAAINIGGGAVLGGAVGGLVARFAKGPRIEDLVPEAAADRPLSEQVQALNDAIRRAADPNDPLQFSEEVVERLGKERDQRIKWNLQDIEPTYTDTGETVRGTYRQELGKSYRPLVGQAKSNPMDTFLNRANNWRNKSPDKLTATRRLIYDPLEAGGYRSEQELADDLSAIGMSREELGMFTQDLKTIEVRPGQGRRPLSQAKPPTAATQELRGEYDQIWGVKQEGRGWVETLNGRVLGDSRAFGTREEAVNAVKGLVRQDPEFRQLAWDIEPPPSSLTPEQILGQRLLTQPQEWNKTRDPLLGRARGLQRRFTNSKVFSDVGQGWRLGREQDGLYVMAKKIAGGAEPAPGDKWVFFRTATPGKFATKAAASNERFMASQYFPRPIEQEKIGEALFDAGTAFLKQTADQPLRKVTPAKNAIQSTLKESGEGLARIAAPTAPLGTHLGPLVNRGIQYLKNMESLAEARIDQLMRGTRQFHGERSLLRNILTLDPPATEGLAKRIDELTPRDLNDVKFVIESEMPFEQVLAANQRMDINGEPLISDGARDLLRALQMISDNFADRVGKLQGAVMNNGAQELVAKFQARKGHYGITRDFPGAYRIFLNDAKGEVIGMVAEADPAAARLAAKEIIEQQAKRGRVVVEGGMVDEALRTPDAIMSLKAKVLRPGFLKNRQDLLGYDLQKGELTNEKMRLLVERNLRRRENYIRNVTMTEQLAETMATLNRSRPQDAIALQKVMDRMMGDEGAFGKVQNMMMDKALHAVGFSGKDSASEIVRVTQKTLTSFQFNFGNLTQPILNMIGTFQTILPEISYVLHASPEALARNYVSVPLLDGRNNVKGTMGILSEWKLFGNAMQRMGVDWKSQPDDFKALVEEMVRQRQLAPRFAEEQFGVDGAILRDPVAAFKSTQSFVKYFESANSLLISKSEELNRMMVVNSAYELAKVMDMPFDRMVHFTREMMGKTAFNYATQDRALMFTTPLGSLAGTFKNWMFHYMANMVKYASGGKETLPALFWQTAATATIGGAAATPFILPIADGASKFLTDKSAMQNLYDATGAAGMDERVADGIMYGLPATLGVSFASQAASPGADPTRDASMIFSFAAFDRMKSLSSATKDALVAYKVTGEGPWEDEIVRGELVRALAPRTFYRSMALSEDHAIKSLATGYDVTKNLGLGGALLYGAGFNPVELEKTYETYSVIRKDQRAQKAAVAELGQSLAQAWESGDDRLANRVYTRAMAIGVDTSSVLRSAQARQARAQDTQLEFTADEEDRESFEFMFNDEE